MTWSSDLASIAYFMKVLERRKNFITKDGEDNTLTMMFMILHWKKTINSKEAAVVQELLMDKAKVLWLLFLHPILMKKSSPFGRPVGLCVLLCTKVFKISSSTKNKAEEKAFFFELSLSNCRETSLQKACTRKIQTPPPLKGGKITFSSLSNCNTFKLPELVPHTDVGTSY